MEGMSSTPFQEAGILIVDMADKKSPHEAMKSPALGRALYARGQIPLADCIILDRCRAATAKQQSVMRDHPYAYPLIQVLLLRGCNDKTVLRSVF